MYTDTIKEIQKLWEEKTNTERENNVEIIKFIIWSKKNGQPKFLTYNSAYYKWASPLKKLYLYSLKLPVENITLKEIQDCGLNDIDELVNFKANLSINNKILKEKYLLSDDFKEAQLSTQTIGNGDQSEIPDVLEQDTEWFFHYLSIVDVEEDREPQIVRTVLQMYKTGKAVLYNKEHLKGEDYNGFWWNIESSNVFSFTLTNNSKSRELHFKFSWPEQERDLVVGAYLTYDKNRIYTGALVMSKRERFHLLDQTSLTNKTKRQQALQTLTLSKKSSGKDRKQINEQIQKYLSLKKWNYYKVPQRFKTIAGMKSFLNEIKSFSDRDDLFFETEKPRIFISFPQTALELDKNQFFNRQDRINLYIKKIQDTFTNDFVVENRSLNKVDPNLNVTKSHLIKLYKTKYFILVLRQLTQVSFSLLELGFALDKCKFIYIIYNKKIVSSRFDALRNFGDNISIDDDIDENTSFDVISNKIITYIQGMEKMLT